VLVRNAILRVCAVAEGNVPCFWLSQMIVEVALSAEPLGAVWAGTSPRVLLNQSMMRTNMHPIPTIVSIHGVFHGEQPSLPE